MARNDRTDDTITTSVPALTLGVPLQTLLNAGQDRLFQVTLDANQTLQIDLRSLGGANEVFVRYGAVPTSVAYDVVSGNALQVNQTVLVPSTRRHLLHPRARRVRAGRRHDMARAELTLPTR